MTLYLSTTLDIYNGIHRKFMKEDDDITDDENGPISEFKTVIIEGDTEWLIYEGDRYNDKQPKGKWMKLGKGTHELTFQPKSVCPLKLNRTWYVYLFEHPNYGGEMHEYYYQNPGHQGISNRHPCWYFIYHSSAQSYYKISAVILGCSLPGLDDYP